MSVAQRLAETDRRRAILAALALAPGYTLPERALRAQIELIGYTVSLDLLRADLGWLEEVGMTEAARLTDRGLDVVMGRASVPGVRRPEPGEL